MGYSSSKYATPVNDGRTVARCCADIEAMYATPGKSATQGVSVTNVVPGSQMLDASLLIPKSGYGHFERLVAQTRQRGRKKEIAKCCVTG